MFSRRSTLPKTLKPFFFLVTTLLILASHVHAFQQLSTQSANFPIRSKGVHLARKFSDIDGLLRLETQRRHDLTRHLRRTTTSTTSLSGAASAGLGAATTTSSASIMAGSFYMALLALQFATQPILTRTFAPKGIVRSTYVLVQDFVRVSVCVLLLFVTGSWATAIQNWSWLTMLRAAGLPALLYSLQNYCSLVAYQNLSAISYNVLNQTKTLSSALWCYFLLKQTQSPRQMVALAVLLASALVMEKVIPLRGLKSRHRDNGSDSKPSPEKQPTPTAKKTPVKRDRQLLLSGVLPVLLASLISGLAGALTQKTLQVQDRNSLLLSGEMAFVSGTLLLTGRLLNNFSAARRNRRSISSPPANGAASNSSKRQPAFTNWTWQTWIPIATNAAGGILVGLVTKHAGSVRKGFALILGMFLSGLLQNRFVMDGEEGGTGRVQSHQWMGGALAALALYLYMTK